MEKIMESGRSYDWEQACESSKDHVVALSLGYIAIPILKTHFWVQSFGGQNFIQQKTPGHT